MVLMTEALHTTMEGTMSSSSLEVQSVALGRDVLNKASLLLHPCSISTPF